MRSAKICSAKIMIDNTSPSIFGYSTQRRRERSGRRSSVSCSGSIRTQIMSARRVHDSHLARARWMTEHGYRDLLRAAMH